MVAISRQVIFLVYQNMTTSILDTAFQFMLYGGFSVVFTALMQYLLMLLQANGEFRFILIVTALGGGFDRPKKWPVLKLPPFQKLSAKLKTTKF